MRCRIDFEDITRGVAEWFQRCQSGQTDQWHEVSHGQQRGCLADNMVLIWKRFTAIRIGLPRFFFASKNDPRLNCSNR